MPKIKCTKVFLSGIKIKKSRHSKKYFFQMIGLERYTGQNVYLSITTPQPISAGL